MSAAPRAILAAGGLVWRATPEGPEIVVVHRPRHDDWALPKGKLEPGERWQDAAIREVREETACEVELGEFAGVLLYEIQGALKIVLYWHMRLVRAETPMAGDEVDEVRWLRVPEEIDRLDYPSERDLVSRERARAPVTGRR